MEIERRNFIYGKQDDEGNWVIDGCIRRGIDEKIAIEIFDEINEFANYAFNKSHAAAYAFITYQTAYLKTFYPVEYMASLISSVEEVDKINSYLLNCKSMGIEKLPPDINKSEDTFTVEGRGIRFGLTAVKNVGRSFVQSVCKERELNGEFKSFADFIHRMSDREINKRAVEGLIKCGAFDSLGVKRAQLAEVYESAIAGEVGAKKTNISGQMTLFGDETMGEGSEMELPNIEEYDKKTLLSYEKETMGMYFSGHPMEEYQEKAGKISAVNMGVIMASVEKDEDGNFVSSADGIKDGDKVKVCGIITSRKNKITKNNTQMAFLGLEDMYAGVEVIVFPKILARYNALLQEENIVVVEGRLSIREDEEPKIIMDNAVSMSAVKAEEAPQKPVDIKGKQTLYVRMGTYDEAVIKTAIKLLGEQRGVVPVCFFCADTKKRIVAPDRYWISDMEGSIRSLSDIFGDENVKLS